MLAIISSTPLIEPYTIYTRNKIMLMTLAIVLIILWALGLLTSTAMGGFIHILLVVAIIMILVRLIQGRRIL
jgi:Family of unknown function (DUF5670)